MADIDAYNGMALPDDGLIRLTHVIYGLHAFSVVMGMLSPALIVTSFLTGWPSIIAVIINYVKRAEARGTFLESHFSWQIRTFWFAALWVVVSMLVAMTVILIFGAWALAVATGLWVVYRIVRGWMALVQRRPVKQVAERV